MKTGLRTPNLKKSLKAKTVGKYKRAAKRAINPTYGKKGTGFIKNPQKAVYNKIYHKTTVDGLASVKKGTLQSSTKKKTLQKSQPTVKTTTSQKICTTSSVSPNRSANSRIIVKDGRAKIGNKFYTKKTILKFRLLFIICGWLFILSGFALLPVGMLFIVLGIFFLFLANTYKKIAKQI